MELKSNKTIKLTQYQFKQTKQKSRSQYIYKKKYSWHEVSIQNDLDTLNNMKIN